MNYTESVTRIGTELQGEERLKQMKSISILCESIKINNNKEKEYDNSKMML